MALPIQFDNMPKHGAADATGDMDDEMADVGHNERASEATSNPVVDDNHYGNSYHHQQQPFPANLLPQPNYAASNGLFTFPPDNAASFTNIDPNDNEDAYSSTSSDTSNSSSDDDGTEVGPHASTYNYEIAALAASTAFLNLTDQTPAARAESLAHAFATAPDPANVKRLIPLIPRNILGNVDPLFVTALAGVGIKCSRKGWLVTYVGRVQPAPSAPPPSSLGANHNGDKEVGTSNDDGNNEDGYKPLTHAKRLPRRKPGDPKYMPAPYPLPAGLRRGDSVAAADEDIKLHNSQRNKGRKQDTSALADWLAAKRTAKAQKSAQRKERRQQREAKFDAIPDPVARAEAKAEAKAKAKAEAKRVKRSRVEKKVARREARIQARIQATGGAEVGEEVEPKKLTKAQRRKVKKSQKRVEREIEQLVKMDRAEAAQQQQQQQPRRHHHHQAEAEAAIVKMEGGGADGGGDQVMGGMESVGSGSGGGDGGGVAVGGFAKRPRRACVTRQLEEQAAADEAQKRSAEVARQLASPYTLRGWDKRDEAT